jgi:hypothetical protein
MTEATLSQKIALGGVQTERDNADHRVGPLHSAEHRRIELNEEIQCIPIESIISIKYSGEIKKELTEQTHARLKTPPPDELSCCGTINRWCCRTFCCCCNSCKNQVHIDPEHTINQIVDEKGERVILITIEYIRYSNINSPSHLNVLATIDAVAYYKDRLHTDTLKFYVLNNRDFEQTDFDLKRVQGARLCRLVTQLKAMAGQYPNESTLQDIISKQEIQVIGDPLQETMNTLVGPGRTTFNLTARVPIHTTQD